jgi:hypothetical protein
MFKKLAFAGMLALACLPALAPAARAQSANPIVAGAQTCTATAAALPGGALANGVVLTADPSNTATIYVGGQGVTTSTGYPLVAGQSISYGSTALSMIYLICAASGPVLHFTGN